MVRSLGFVFTFAVAVCLVGCGDNGGVNTMENEEQSAIEAYEAEMAAEEAAMSEDFSEEN